MTAYDCDRCGDVHPNGCRAHSSQTGRGCRAHPVPGANVCHNHGGAAPQVRAAANRRVALADFAADLPDHVDPADALLDELRRSYAVVRWLEHTVAEITPGTHPLTSAAVITNDDKRWLDLYGTERDRLARVAKMAADAGVAERRVQLEEAHAEVIARLLIAIAADPALGLDRDGRQQFRTVAARHLRALPVTTVGDHL